MSDLIKAIIDIAVRERIVDREAIEDPEGYDDGVMMERLESFAAHVIAEVKQSEGG